MEALRGEAHPGGQLLKVEVLDHVIMGHATERLPKDYCSLRELGYFCI